MAHGVIAPKDALYLRITVGEARDAETNEVFELDVLASGYVPIITCRRTKKRFVLPWKDMIALAVEAGITGEGTEPEEGPDGTEPSNKVNING